MNCSNPKILFYEWSDLNNIPLGFYTDEQFLDFCYQSNINVNKKENKYIGDKLSTVYAMCKKGKAELILSNSRKNLQRNYRREMKRSMKTVQGDAEI